MLGPCAQTSRSKKLWPGNHLRLYVGVGDSTEECVQVVDRGRLAALQAWRGDEEARFNQKPEDISSTPHPHSSPQTPPQAPGGRDRMEVRILATVEHTSVAGADTVSALRVWHHGRSTRATLSPNIHRNRKR